MGVIWLLLIFKLLLILVLVLPYLEYYFFWIWLIMLTLFLLFERDEEVPNFIFEDVNIVELVVLTLGERIRLILFWVL